MPEHDPKIKEQLDEYITMKTDGDKGKPKDGDKKPPERIPLPDYTNPASRIKYAKEFTKKYGELMSGRGDTPLRINERPFNGVYGGQNAKTSKELALAATSKLGIDPALFYASAMEEGQSGLYPNEKGDLRVGSHTTKDFPIEGSADLGLDTFVGRYPEFVKKGYLPADFKSKFTPLKTKNSDDTQDSALYKTLDDALLAKAAFVKSNYDEVDEYTKKKGIDLSPKARDFFALINYNAGSGTGQQMINDYNANGLLKDDSFLKSRPTSGKGLKETSYAVPYENVIRRLRMADALKSEGYFDEDKPESK